MINAIVKEIEKTPVFLAYHNGCNNDLLSFVEAGKENMKLQIRVKQEKHDMHYSQIFVEHPEINSFEGEPSLIK